MGLLPSNDLHVVADALFPTAETIGTASSLDIRLTWSQNAAHQAKLVDFYSDALPHGLWRSACVPSGDNLVSKHFFLFQDSKLMIGGSTAFQIGEQPPRLPWKEGCTPSIARDLSTLKKESLTWLVTALPDASLHDCGSTNASMVSHITGISPEHWAKSHPWIGKKVEVVCSSDNRMRKIEKLRGKKKYEIFVLFY